MPLVYQPSRGGRKMTTTSIQLHLSTPTPGLLTEARSLWIVIRRHPPQQPFLWIVSPTNSSRISNTQLFVDCISQEVPGRCGIELSLTIIGLVIACGIVKIVTMFVILWKFTKEDTIVTIGDGIQSFIETRDATTRNLCLETRHDIVKAWKTPLDGRRGQTFHKPSTESWFRAASIKRWSVPIIL